MINEFSVKPKPKNNNAKIVTVIALGLGALTIIVSMLIPKFRGVVGTVGVCFLVTAILLYTKFVTPVYYYDVVLDNNGLPLLVVRQVVGKRATTLCRVDVYAIRKMESQTGKESRAHKTPAGMKKYVYTPTLFPPSVYRLTVISEYENWLKKQNGVWEDEDLYFSELEKCTVVLDSDSKRKGQTLKKLKVYLRHENTVKCFELENGRGSFLNSDDCFYRGERKDLAYLYLRMKNLEPECGIYGMDKNLNLKNKERLRAGDRLCWYTPECEEKVWEVTGIFEKESWDDNI